MKLEALTPDLKRLKKGSVSQISTVTNDDRKVKNNSLFVAIKGTKVDGHSFLKKSIKEGAKAVVIQDKRYFNEIKKYNVSVFWSSNTRKALALIAHRFYKKPSLDLKLIGTTGTNGKTTVSNFIYQYLELLGKNTGLIGTIGYKYKDTTFNIGMTTPDSICLNKILNNIRRKNAEYVSMEVSSHASHQDRIYGLRFEGGIFTNLTQDHLDYHKNMEDYFSAKRKFFYTVLEKNENALFSINVDDYYGKKLFSELEKKAYVVSYGKNAKHFKIKDYEISMDKTQIQIEYRGKIYKVETQLRGIFNVYNIIAALSFLTAYKFDIEELIQLTQFLKPVKGRFEIVHSNDFLVINDYAHTPDALKNILKSLNSIKKGRIISVFGAGGDRDKSKRPKMGEVAEKFSDVIILTSDNPRSEDPKEIIKDIKAGIKNSSKIIEIINREEAIKYAIDIAKKDDIILIAGKGHETYQIINDKTYHFDDSDVARKYLERK